MNAIYRGLKNIWRNKARSLTVMLLLTFIMTLLIVLVEVNNASKKRLIEIESQVQTLIEIRPAGMSAANYSEDKASPDEGLNTKTVEKVQRIPHAKHITKIEEYIYRAQIDTTRSNAFSILIGMKPESEMRASGEINYEQSRIIAGEGLKPEDADSKAMVVGRLYAKQRLSLTDTEIRTYKTKDKTAEVNGESFVVKGIYETGNDLSENHAFMPINAFRRLFNPDNRLSRIFVTVDSVKNVEAVTQELKSIQEADIITAPGAVSATSQYISNIAKVSGYTSILAIIAGVALVTFTMILSLKERVREVGVIKAIGGSNSEVVTQFIGESIGMTILSGLIAIILYILGSQMFGSFIGIPLQTNVNTFTMLLWISILFGGIGSLYPVMRGISISPIEAIKKT